MVIKGKLDRHHSNIQLIQKCHHIFQLLKNDTTILSIFHKQHYTHSKTYTGQYTLIFLLYILIQGEPHLNQAGVVMLN
jgi:hypothetical protein